MGHCTESCRAAHVLVMTTRHQSFLRHPDTGIVVTFLMFAGTASLWIISFLLLRSSSGSDTPAGTDPAPPAFATAGMDLGLLWVMFVFATVSLLACFVLQCMAAVTAARQIERSGIQGDTEGGAEDAGVA